jgi:hypothetical protein
MLSSESQLKSENFNFTSFNFNKPYPSRVPNQKFRFSHNVSPRNKSIQTNNKDATKIQGFYLKYFYKKKETGLAVWGAEFLKINLLL